MGRPSKLTPEQWAEIGRRLIDGESKRALAREFGISDAALREYIGKQGRSETVQNVARQLVEAESALASLPIAAQVSARNLADRLLSISNSYAMAAELATKTGHRLHALANSEVGKVDDANPLAPESLEAMKGIALLTRLGNDALVPASNLLAANKDTMQKINDAKPPEEAPVVRPQVERAEWLKLHGLT